jgi:DNA repair protein RecO
MQAEEKLQGFVLKRQPLGEADLLVTWYTRQRGKIRTLAVAGLRSKSKLSFGLNPGVEAALRIVGKSTNLSYRLIGVEPLRTVLQNYTEANSVMLLWLMELLLKSTPDDEANPRLYEVFLETVTLLEDARFSEGLGNRWQFYSGAKVLAELGWPIELPMNLDTSKSPRGEEFEQDYFYAKSLWSGLSSAEVSLARQYLEIPSSTFFHLETHPSEDKKLAGFMDQYISYHLDRNIRSKQVWNAIIE